MGNNSAPTSDFPNGITSMGQLILGVPTQGNVWWVNPSKGSDSFDGTTPATAFATLVAALAVCNANQNDVVFLLGTTDAATPTTYRVPAGGGLNWNKDGVSLIGICAGQGVSNRARIANLSTDVTTNTLFTLSANNCRIHNVGFFHGVAGWTGASGGVPMAVQVSGQHNHITNCAIQGLGDGTALNSMDVALGGSLGISGSENLFEDCYVGLNTVSLGNTTASEIQLNGALVSRNKFLRGEVTGRSGSVNHRMVRAAAASFQDIGLVFDSTLFTNSGQFQGGQINDACFTIGASQQGVILLKDCGSIGNGLWEKTSVSGNLYITNPSVAAGKEGIATVAVGT